jgi:predicted CoA-binding protein/CYTH domain-containing protein
MSGPLEIERVWVLRAMPVVPAGAERWTIQQGYLPLPGERGASTEPDFPEGPEGRLRRILRPDGTAMYRHTIKRGGGMVREEVERAIEREEFERLWPMTAGRRVEKTRYRVREGDLTWELDRFHSLPLVMLEVELPEASHAAPLPSWAAPLVVREVTEDARYRNAALAIEGLPPGAPVTEGGELGERGDGGRGGLDDSHAAVEAFLAGRVFAVVGASNDRSKFGNRVLRHYIARGRRAIPVHPREQIVEGIPAVGSLRELPEPVDGVSIIGPPEVTLRILDDAVAAGCRRLWLQPGAEDEAVLSKAARLGLLVIAGGPCVLVALRG